MIQQFSLHSSTFPQPEAPACSWVCVLFPAATRGLLSSIWRRWLGRSCSTFSWRAAGSHQCSCSTLGFVEAPGICVTVQQQRPQEYCLAGPSGASQVVGQGWRGSCSMGHVRLVSALRTLWFTARRGQGPHCLSLKSQVTSTFQARHIFFSKG